MSNGSSGDLVARRYEYLIATHLHRIAVDENDREACQRAEMHVKRAREHGMPLKDIWARLYADSWYDDLEDHGESLPPLEPPSS